MLDLTATWPSTLHDLLFATYLLHAHEAFRPCTRSELQDTEPAPIRARPSQSECDLTATHSHALLNIPTLESPSLQQSLMKHPAPQRLLWTHQLLSVGHQLTGRPQLQIQHPHLLELEQKMLKEGRRSSQHGSGQKEGRCCLLGLIRCAWVWWLGHRGAERAARL